MTLFKSVNKIVDQEFEEEDEKGQLVLVVRPVNVVVQEAMTLEEEEATLREWAENDPASLTRRKTAAVLQLKAETRSAIYAGFDSAALGRDHHYPLSDTDQRNLQRALSLATLNQGDAEWRCMIQCKNGEDIAIYRAHDAAQTLQVGQDAQRHIETQLIVLGGRIDAVLAAKSADDISKA